MEEDAGPIEYDRWNWHTEGVFPADQPPEQGFVHIAMFLTWLVRKDMLDPEWVRAHDAAEAVQAIRSGDQTGSALRGPSGGAFTGDMLNAEGRAFANAYYLPEYGYAQDYSRTFGRRAEAYAVVDGRESYERLSPALDRRYEEWVAAGRPPLVPMQSLLPSWLGFLRPRG